MVLIRTLVLLARHVMLMLASIYLVVAAALRVNAQHAVPVKRGDTVWAVLVALTQFVSIAQ